MYNVQHNINRRQLDNHTHSVHPFLFAICTTLNTHTIKQERKYTTNTHSMGNTNTNSNTHTHPQIHDKNIWKRNDGQKHQKRQHHFNLHSSRKLTLLCHKNWQFFCVLLLLFLLQSFAYADYYMHCFHPLQSLMTGPTDIYNVFSFSIIL